MSFYITSLTTTKISKTNHVQTTPPSSFFKFKLAGEKTRPQRKSCHRVLRSAFISLFRRILPRSFLCFVEFFRIHSLNEMGAGMDYRLTSSYSNLNAGNRVEHRNMLVGNQD